MNQINPSDILSISDEDMKKTDFIITIDTSSSMQNPSLVLVGKSRYEEVLEEAKGVAFAASRFDDDGVTLIFFGNGKTTVVDNVTPSNIEAIFEQQVVGGGTPTHLAIQEIHKKSKASSKEVVALVYTDGVPDDKSDVEKAIITCAKDLGGEKTGILFNQVGNDISATQFLEKLDDGLPSDIPDIVCSLTVQQAAGLTIKQKAWLARNA